MTTDPLVNLRSLMRGGMGCYSARGNEGCYSAVLSGKRWVPLCKWCYSVGGAVMEGLGVWFGGIRDATQRSGAAAPAHTTMSFRFGARAAGASAQQKRAQRAPCARADNGCHARLAGAFQSCRLRLLVGALIILGWSAQVATGDCLNNCLALATCPYGKVGVRSLTRMCETGAMHFTESSDRIH